MLMLGVNGRARPVGLGSVRLHNTSVTMLITCNA
uniref:Uncharacterized protein n=1 Tax=Rhizophora mucronata TaxID=61149 RepID=A0A2P2PC54_RHIMU